MMTEQGHDRRSPPPRLTGPEIDAIADAVGHRVLRNICSHAEDHEWIYEQREAAAARTRFWRKMLEHAVKWGIISILSILFYALWLGLKEHVLR